MRINCYVDDEYVLGMGGVTDENMNDVQKILIKNPTVVDLSIFQYFPEVGSTYDGTSFSSISSSNYEALTESGSIEYFALVVDGVVEKVMDVSDPMQCAIMASNPVFKLEGDQSGPVKVATV
jgi:hypothetical protein